MIASAPTLCVFVKSPELGLVKTRLALSVGKERAAALASAFIVDTVASARGVSAARLVLVLSGNSTALPPAVKEDTLWDQGDGDLGSRLERCLQRALIECPAGLVIGTDSPGLPARAIVAALKALETHDAVIGPAEDGGFYLIGLTRCPPGLFNDIPWSSAETCSQTITRLAQFGLSTAVVEPWFDIDEARDLERLRGMLARGEVHADETARLLGL